MTILIDGLPVPAIGKTGIGAAIFIKARLKRGSIITTFDYEAGTVEPTFEALTQFADRELNNFALTRKAG